MPRIAWLLAVVAVAGLIRTTAALSADSVSTPESKAHPVAPSRAAPYDVALPAFPARPAPDNDLPTLVGMPRPGTRETRSFVLPRVGAFHGMVLGAVHCTFVSPDGHRFEVGHPDTTAGWVSAEAESVGFYELTVPRPGSWDVIVDAPPGDSAEAYAVITTLDDPADVVAHLEMLLRGVDPHFAQVTEPGDTVFVRTCITRDGHPLRGTSWEVHTTNSSRPSSGARVIPVHDDGRHADGAAGDGVFVGSVITARPDGIYSVLAEGLTTDGVRLQVSDSIDLETQIDLQLVDSIDVQPPHPKAGEPVQLAITGRNQSAIEVRDVSLELSVDDRPESAQRVNLSARESRRLRATWVPAGPGTYRLRWTIGAYVDSYWSNLSDNTRTTIVTVK